MRLARDQEEIVKAQQLRYHVFYELMSAKPSEACKAMKRDVDHFDEICDHLLVIDKTSDQDKVIGNYRLLSADCHTDPDFFYSHQEYDIFPLLERAREENMSVMELGRSCVHPDYRNHSIIQMLWRGIVAYAMSRDVGLMFGCASFPGTDVNMIRDHLAYLHAHRLAIPEWRAKARDELYIDMRNDDIIKEQCEHELLSKMPPLVKGYLRLGAWVGDGAVVDEQFDTTDVLITLPVSQIKKRYLDFFARL